MCRFRLLAVVTKNLRIKKRLWLGTLIELFLPGACMLLLIWLRSEVDVSDVPANDFLETPLNNPSYIPSSIVNAIHMHPYDVGVRGKSFWTSVNLDGPLQLRLQKTHQRIAIVNNASLAEFIASIPGYENSTMQFESALEMEQYLNKRDYGLSPDTPQLFAAIHVRSLTEDNELDIAIRMNATAGRTSMKSMDTVDTHIPPWFSTQKKVNFQWTKIYWNGGVRFSKVHIPLSEDSLVDTIKGSANESANTTDFEFLLPSGGFIDLQALIYSWVYKIHDVFNIPDPRTLPRCTCPEDPYSPDLSTCEQDAILRKLYRPYMSHLLQHENGCRGRLDSLFPLAWREVPFPTQHTVSDPFAQVMEKVIGLFFVLVFMWPLTKMLKSLVEDKENHLFEVMRIMGLSEELIMAGWYLSYGLLCIILTTVTVLVPASMVFSNSTPFALWVFFFAFSCTLLSFSAFMSSFFTRAKTAMVIGAVVFLVTYFPYVMVKDDIFWKQILSMLSPAVALSFGATVLIKLESSGDGLHFNNFWVPINGSVRMMDVLFMLLIDFVFYTVLHWYCEKVFRTEDRYPWYFVLRDAWQCLCRGRTVRRVAQDLPLCLGSSTDEAVGVELFAKRSVAIRDLQKTFGSFTAVNGVSYDLFDDHIFVLLGHNGAGKTTTVNMLTGTLAPSAGDAIVYEKYSLVQHMRDIRRIVGFCPQHNVIWDNLTVHEHVVFFASIKNVPRGELESHVYEAIHSVGLDAKTHALAKSLSGGEKRRLSLAIAFLGDTKIVFLDEPTSGVDPASRREIWDFLRRKKQSRTILITTHFMDEAEILGDRIAIMHKGTLACSGNPFFLKSLYGVGYTLTVEDVGSGRALTQQYLPSAQVLSDVGQELRFRVPFDASTQFSALFAALEDSNIPYGVSVTTLEEVFLRVGRDDCVDAGTREAQRESSHAPLLRGRSSVNSRGSCPIHAADKESHSRAHVKVMGMADGQPSASSSVGEQADARAGKNSKSANAKHVDTQTSAAKPDCSSRRAAAGAARASVASEDIEMCVVHPDTSDSDNEAFLSYSMERKPTPCRQMHAILAKRFHSAKRDICGWVCQLVLPLVFLLVALCSIRYGGFATYPSQPLTLSSINDMTPEVLVAQRTGNTTWFTGSDITYATASTDTDFARTLTNGYYAHATGRYAAYFIEEPSSTQTVQTTRNVDITYQDKKRTRETVNVTMTIPPLRGPWGAPRARPGTLHVRFTCHPPVPESAKRVPQVIDQHMSIPLGAAWDETITIDIPFHKPGSSTNVSLNIVLPRLGRVTNRIGVDVFWNSTARDGLPIAFHRLASSVLRQTLARDGKVPVTLQVTNDPLPLSGNMQGLIDSQTSIFLALGFAFIPASYVAFIVKERHTGAKHVQLLAGVNFVVYWAATWLWDFLNFLVPGLLSFALIYLFDIDSLMNNDNAMYTLLLILGYGFSVCPFTYAMSFFFTSHTTALVCVLLSYFFYGGTLPIVALVLQFLPKTKGYFNSTLVWIFRISPNFCLADGLNRLILLENPGLQAVLKGHTSAQHAYDFTVTGSDLLVLCISALVYFLLTLVLEVLFHTPCLRRCVTTLLPGRSRIVPDPPTDEMVLAEKQRLLTDADERVQVLGLSKVYKHRTVVNDIYFGIRAGECFGYLGVNGAGKTTTMKMLTGDIIPTAGTATMNGHDILTAQHRVRRNLGYCPQFDALLDNLTGREHLIFFGRLRGFEENDLKVFAARLLEKLTLTMYADVCVKHYSGGNKRKLSIGISLIADPPVLFLDEPTTGVDPISRRFIWDLISDTVARTKASVILTTHSMDECEALCHRAAIIHNGTLRFFGTLNEIKARHGIGYQFDVTVPAHASLEVVDSLHSFVINRFQGAELLEKNVRKLQYRLTKEVPLSKVFETIELHKKDLNIQEYAVSETTIEQIFIRFANAAEVPDGEAEVAQDDIVPTTTVTSSGSVVLPVRADVAPPS